MPPKPRTTSKKLVEQEGRILLPISSLQKKEIPTIRRAATVFGVPYSTLYDRINGCKYWTEKRANGHKMTPNEEESLLQYLLSGILPPLLLSERTGSQSSLNANQRSKADTHGDIIMSEQNAKI
jgi:hypothetical protein